MHDAIERDIFARSCLDFARHERTQGAASSHPALAHRYDRKIFSIALPLASSSIILSRMRISRISGSSIVSTRTPQTTPVTRSEEHTSELQSLMRISYAVFCLKKKKKKNTHNIDRNTYRSNNHTRPYHA